MVSPEKAVKRNIARQQLNILNSGYGNHGASQTKKSLLGWMFGGGSPKEDIDDNLPILRERSRDLYMGGSPIATGAIKTMRTNVIGAGLRLKAHLDVGVLGITEEEADALELQIEKEFELWSESKNCDAQRMNNFYELQQLAFISTLLSGEVFTCLPYLEDRGVYGICVQLIEADRCLTPTLANIEQKPKIVSGIEIGEYGEPIGYYIANHHPLSENALLLDNKSYKRIPAFGEKTGLPNILHIMVSERPGQLRGVPLLSPVIESLKQLGRYTDAELMAAVVSGMYTIFITREQASSSDTPFGASIPLEDEVDSEDQYSYELGNGSIVGLAPGEKIQESNPGRPNTAFDGFVTAISRQIGTALEIPYELLVKQFTASYSASRAALLESWKMFKMRRTWMTNDFCQPIYEQWFTEAVSKGRINAPGFFGDPLVRKAYLGSEWSGPTQGQIDPLKEVEAAKRRVEQGFSTRQRETIELTGGDFINNARQRAKEEKLMGLFTETEKGEDKENEIN